MSVISARNKKSPRRRAVHPRTARPVIAALGVIALLAAFLAIPAILGRLYNTPSKKPVMPPQPQPALPAWPYGQPEYHVEVPQGYEGLLPPSPGQSATEHQGGDIRKEPGSAIPAARPEGKPPAAERRIPGPKAERFVDIVFRTRVEKEPPTLIIVIDDAGHNMEQLEPYLALPFPLTIAVLPGLAHSQEAARRVLESGKEAILHQPMEALGGNDPGPGSIRISMEPQAAKEVLAKNLDSLPGMAGVNNHMGSAVTRSPSHMEAVLELVKERGIYYLDSLTTQGTVTAEFCAASQIPYWERDVFLDNSGDRQSILRALEEGKQEATKKGAAVLIGHVWSSELAQTLMDIYPKLVEEGYSLSTISKFMIRSASEDEDARPWN